ncbi:MAG TPA: hypothetical protein PKM44_15165 [Turneriella sp.]|nr:hypothetical protein [Turneriella sp.]HMY11423.1 hypothetical protein [Turneriella sp.]HNA80412.1 hypothetical protein [Turneriella sp.]HNE20797.1 hypothetical protein [Turneriella sp.]HNL11853.1 hypothetical protein [Turneriella sp.]
MLANEHPHIFSQPRKHPFVTGEIVHRHCALVVGECRLRALRVVDFGDAAEAWLEPGRKLVVRGA